MNTLVEKRNWSWLIAAGITVLIVLWMASGALRSEDTPPDEGNAATAPETIPEVRVDTQRSQSVTRVVRVYGRTAPARIVTVRAETDGRVVSTGAVRGRRVETDSVLVTLDTRDREARLAQANATVRQRELEYKAQESLKPNGYISEARLAEATALLEGARAELRRAQLDLEHRIVRAPFAGALQERHVEIGDYVSAGDPVATFVDDRTLIVSGDVAEHDVAGLQLDGPGEAELITGQRVTGRLRYIAPSAAISTRTFGVELEVDNETGAIPVGVTAQLLLPGEETVGHKVSPALLTLDDDGNLGVKTVEAGNLVAFHPVDVSLSSSDGVWLTGLPDEVTIITVGQGYVRAGDRVRPVAANVAQREDAVVVSEAD